MTVQRTMKLRGNVGYEFATRLLTDGVPVDFDAGLLEVREVAGSTGAALLSIPATLGAEGWLAFTATAVECAAAVEAIGGGVAVWDCIAWNSERFLCLAEGDVVTTPGVARD